VIQTTNRVFSLAKAQKIICCTLLSIYKQLTANPSAAMASLFLGIDLHLIHRLKTVAPIDVLEAIAVGLLTFIKVKKVQSPVLIALQGLGLNALGFW
jgi:hypothetical protein